MIYRAIILSLRGSVNRGSTVIVTHDVDDNKEIINEINYETQW